MNRLVGSSSCNALPLLATLEFAASSLTLFVVHYFVSAPTDSGMHPRALLLAGLYGLILWGCLSWLGLYRRNLQPSIPLLLRLVTSLLLSAVLFGACCYWFASAHLTRHELLLSILLSGAVLLLIRATYYRWLGRQQRLVRVLVLGAGEKAAMLQELDSEALGFRLVGFVRTCETEQAVVSDVNATTPVIDFNKPLSKLVRDQQAELLVIAADECRNNLPPEEVLDCKMQGISVLDPLSFYARQAMRLKLDLLQPSWIFFSESFGIGPIYQQAKRLLDLALASLLLVLLSPLLILLGLAIWLEAGGRGSILLSQTRVGLHGETFSMLKFRTIMVDAQTADRPRWVRSNDARITPMGTVLRRFALDDMPQLLNVLRGEMSLVGPRAERPEFVNQLSEEIPYYDQRHRLKPGLTGWAQLRHPGGASTDDVRQKLEYDLYYLKNASLYLDTLVMIETLLATLRLVRNPSK